MMSPLTRLRPHRAPLLLLALLPVLVNAPVLSGLFNDDPALQFIGLGTAMRPGLFGAQQDWLDPTVGYITQPVGHLVAHDWLHGIIPWWNPYSGVGMPLAAEMQSAVFFLPFVLLLHWNNGWFLLRLALEIGCGLFAYAFFIEIGLRRMAAFLGGALYSLSPLFFLSPHAAIDPLPFLPLLLLGIERAARAARDGRPLGWPLVTIATAYAILGGFPETAYLDGLLAALWTLWRAANLPWRLRPRFAGKLAAALLIALMLCAPLLIPFFEYLPLANLGPHGGPLFTYNRLEAALMPLQIFPYLYGPLAAPPPAGLAPMFGGGWVRVPSWVDIPVLALAIAALWRRGPLRQPRWVLLAWLVFWEARYAGLTPVSWLVDQVPGLATSDVIRFSGPMLSFCVFILAAFGLDDLLRCGALGAKRLLGVLGSLCVIAAAAIAPVAGLVAAVWRQEPADFLAACCAALAVLAVLALLCFCLRRPRHGLALTAALLVIPFATLCYPQFAGFRGGRLDMAPLRFLQAHEGTARMVSLGPLDLDFPVRYGIASINYAAMPTPRAWTDYIAAHLYSRGDLSIYSGAAPEARGYLLQHLPDYAALGVRYIVTRADDDLIAKPFPLAALPQGVMDQHTAAYILVPGQKDLTGTMAASLSARAIGAASVFLGTFSGESRGPLVLTLCAAGHCQSASRDTGTLRDSVQAVFRFPAPLAVPPGAVLSYRFSHPAGARVAVWQVADSHGTLYPSFAFFTPDGAPITGEVHSNTGYLRNNLTLVFRDGLVSIYRIANAAPYASSPDPGCRVDIVSRQEMRTSCAAPGRLLRREMFFPGWSAAVNGAARQVRRDGLFQAVNLPAGPAVVRFTYAPPHIRLAAALALAALLLWAVLLAWPALNRQS